MSDLTSNRKTVPTFEGRLYTLEGNHVGNWVRRAEVDALLDEIEQLKRELQIQKATVDLAYIPHRSLSDSRQRADRENERLRAALKRLIRAWTSDDFQERTKALGEAHAAQTISEGRS